MAPRCLTFAMLLVVGIVVLGNLPGTSADCRISQLPSILLKCGKFIKKTGPKIPASQDCCKALQDADFPCPCKYIIPPIEIGISVEKVIYVARTCGIPVQEGTKCGSYTVPPDTPSPVA